ncbi:MAG: DUF2157 domain-containing protein [Planctomycetes bacterium]|nr:DUF2157 domain-containing protein [Planctomycetota bacterium]
MNRKGVRWLYEELPGLVGKGVISTDAAEALRRHYGDLGEGRWRQVILTICGVLGALLVGLGIIFVLAYNWSAIPRSVRTVLALVPLVAGQGAVAWVIWRRKASAAWREGAAVFLALALGASIALIDQTYHTGGDYDAMLLPWMLLGLPLVYLLGSTATAVLYLAAVLWWAGCADLHGVQRLAIWLLALLVGPHWWLAVRQDRYALRSVFLGWAVALWAGLALLFALEGAGDVLWCVGFLAVYAILYLAGSEWFAEGASRWRRPLQTVGAAGVVVVAYVLSFRWVWEHVGVLQLWDKAWQREAVAGAGTVAVALTAALVLLGFAARRGQWWQLMVGGAPLVGVLGVVLADLTGAASAPAWLFNAYVLALAVGAMVVGIRERRLAMANAGALMVALLIVARFSDSEMGFLVKGVACIVVGAGFLATNVVYHRLRGGAAR